MSSDERFAEIEKSFSNRVRIAAENSRGQFSSVWIFWGRNSDFYFSARSVAGALKVSLHKNGFGYVGFDKSYHQRMLAAGFGIGGKSILSWKFPEPGEIGAKQVAFVRLPANYCRGAKPRDVAGKRVLILGIEDGSAADIGIFVSRESTTTLEAKFLKIGKPIVGVCLDNGLTFSIVVRSIRFDPCILPTTEKLNRSVRRTLIGGDDIAFHEGASLNAILHNKPKDNELLQIIDVGGLTMKRLSPNP